MLRKTADRFFETRVGTLIWGVISNYYIARVNYGAADRYVIGTVPDENWILNS